MNRMLLNLAGRCELLAAGDAEGKKIPRFKMLAYTGGPMRVGYWDAPVVIDLAGMAIPSQKRPIRMQHDATLGVGHTEKIEVVNGELLAEGVVSRATEAARDVVESARNGFPWEASVGANVKKYEFVRAGQSAIVNGRSHVGPLYVMRETVLGEISFVDMGADGGTQVSVAATAPQPQREKEESAHMNFDAWLKAKGLDPATLTEAQRADLQAQFDAEQKKTAVPPPPPPVTAAAPAAPAPVLQFREAEAAESRRIGAIRKVCAGGQHTEIEAKAIAEGWTVERAELEVLRASRPTPPNVVTRQDTLSQGQMLQCAAEQTLRLGGFEQRFKPEIVEAADRRYRGRLGLQELLVLAAAANGFAGNRHEMRDVLRYAFQPHLCAGGFSAVDISGILSTTANKALLEAYNFVEATWREIAARRSVTDFKTITSYRLTGSLDFEEVGPTGEIKHGELDEASFTNQAKTYGKMLALTRQDIINDDLGALTRLPQMLGRGAALKLNNVFWTAFLDNASFFTGTGKYISGASTVLGVDGLSAAEAAFLDKVDSDGHPLGINPAILLVPTALSAVAQQLYKGSEIRDTTSNKQYLVVNPHAGKYRVAVSRYLANSAYTGYSALAWYLLADPRDVATIEVCFLNGRETPVVEDADADFNTLGVQMRGYFDFGVAKQDANGGLKSKGAA